MTDSGGRSGTATVRVTVTGGGGPAGGAPPPASTTGAETCATASAFRSLRVKPRGRGLRFAFSRAAGGRVAVDVFRAATARRVGKLRRVARFRNRSRSFTWKGRGVRAGTYYTRVRLRGDVRRHAFARRSGRFRARPAFARRDGCGPIRAFKLERPVFGGPARPLRVSFRLAAPGRARVDVLRGGKVVRRVSNRRRQGLRTYRLRIAARGLERGTYRVRLRAGGARSKLAARRL